MKTRDLFVYNLVRVIYTRPARSKNGTRKIIYGRILSTAVGPRYKKTSTVLRGLENTLLKACDKDMVIFVTFYIFSDLETFDNEVTFFVFLFWFSWNVLVDDHFAH